MGTINGYYKWDDMNSSKSDKELTLLFNQSLLPPFFIASLNTCTDSNASKAENTSVKKETPLESNIAQPIHVRRIRGLVMATAERVRGRL